MPLRLLFGKKSRNHDLGSLQVIHKPNTVTINVEAEHAPILNVDEGDQSKDPGINAGGLGQWYAKQPNGILRMLYHKRKLVFH
jgi:hypothetical protein